jgi:light-harvesting complex I chlorophyll a/b binding protein 4
MFCCGKSDASSFSPCASVLVYAGTNAVCGLSMQKSAAIPYLDKPPALDGKYEGDVGFDPLWISSALPDAGWIKYLREAEIKHGRVAMLAATGAIFQDMVQFQGTETLVGSAKMTGAHDALLKLEYAKDSKVATMHQMLLWIGVLEMASAVAVAQMWKGETAREPGDFGFDPLGFGKDAAALSTYRLKEIKNGRLAMIGIGGMVHHYILTGKGPLQFLSGIPNYKSCVEHANSPLTKAMLAPVGNIMPKIC